MAKLSSSFKHDGTFDGVTVVRSRAYGEHIRKARTKFTLGEAMVDSSKNLTVANGFAKAFKDAIDPFRADCRDGQLWQRLVTIFKAQISEEGKAGFNALEGLELHRLYPLSRIISTTADVSQQEGMLNVTASTSVNLNPTQGRANGYQQRLIVFFADADLTIQSFSATTHFPLSDTRNEQTASWSIPANTAVVLLMVKCSFTTLEIPMGLKKAMGMRVLKVMPVEG